MSTYKKLLNKSKIWLKKHFISLSHTPKRKKKVSNRKNECRRQVSKQLMSQRHVVNEMLNSEKENKKKKRRKENKPNQTRGFPRMGLRQPTWPFLGGQPQHPWETPPGLWPFLPMGWGLGTQPGTQPTPEFSLPCPDLEHKVFSSTAIAGAQEPHVFLSYLSTAVASVVDCRGRETEASGTAQSQEVAETPQKGWGDGEGRSGKLVEGEHSSWQTAAASWASPVGSRGSSRPFSNQFAMQFLKLLISSKLIIYICTWSSFN